MVRGLHHYELESHAIVSARSCWNEVGRNHALNVYGPYTKLINLVIHDAGQGAGLWSQAMEMEMYGCIIYNNGILAPDRGHGHGVYMQNQNGVKTLRDNILFNEFGNLLQAYGSAAAAIRNVRFEGNVVFNGRFIMGGAQPAEDITFRSNYFYRSAPQFGYDSKANRKLLIEQNYFASGLLLNWWKGVVIRDNTLYNMTPDGQTKSVSVTLAPGGTLADYAIDGNRYFQSYPNGNDFYVRFPQRGDGYTFSRWQQETGYDKASAYRTGPRLRPPNAVFIRRNEYDPGRAHIIIYNWERRDSVDVDGAGLGLRPGDSWELRNVENYLLESIAGTYTGRRHLCADESLDGGQTVRLRKAARREHFSRIRGFCFPQGCGGSTGPHFAGADYVVVGDQRHVHLENRPSGHHRDRIRNHRPVRRDVPHGGPRFHGITCWACAGSSPAPSTFTASGLSTNPGTRQSAGLRPSRLLPDMRSPGLAMGCSIPGLRTDAARRRSIRGVRSGK